MYRKILFLGTLIALLVSGCSFNSNNTSVSGTGIKILQETPEQAYLTYFELFNSKDRLAAYDLISPENRKKAPKNEFQEWLKTVPYKSEKVMYTVSAEEGSLAVTGVIKLIDVNETTAAVYSIFAIVSDGSKWYVEMDVDGLRVKKGKEVNKLAQEVHKKVNKALAAGEISLDEKFKKQIEGQVTAFQEIAQAESKSKPAEETKSDDKSNLKDNSRVNDKSKIDDNSKNDGKSTGK